MTHDLIGIIKLAFSLYSGVSLQQGLRRHCTRFTPPLDKYKSKLCSADNKYCKYVCDAYVTFRFTPNATRIVAIRVTWALCSRDSPENKVEHFSAHFWSSRRATSRGSWSHLSPRCWGIEFSNYLGFCHPVKFSHPRVPPPPLQCV